MNKKGVGRFLEVIIALPILLIFAMIGTIGFYEIGQEFIIEDISNVTQTIAGDLNLSPSYAATISQGETNFNTLGSFMKYDLFFAFIMITAFSSTVILALKAPRIPTFSFLGMSTVGIMMILLIIFFLDQFVDWWLDEFFYLLFDNLTIATPFLDWFFDNLSIISIIWFALLLLLNQVEVDFKELFSRSSSSSDVDALGEGRVEE